MVTKYQLLYDRLCEQIAQGIYPPGSKLPTEAALAAQGYSRNTVRQALELLAQEGRIVKRRGSGSVVAPAHTGPQSGNVAVLVQDFSTTIFPKLIGGITEGLHGWGVPLLYSASGKLEEEERILQELAQKQIDGLLVNGLFTALPNPNLPLYQALIDRGVPVVFLLSPYRGLRGSYTVTNDDIGGGEQAVEYLYRSGRRAPCGIFTADFILGLDRYAGYVNACKRLGLPLQSGHILWLYSRSYQASEHHAPQILSLVEGCDSVVCQNDFIARLVIQTLTGAGIRIPQDIAVISFDNTYLCDYPPVSLTSLDGNSYEAGRQAARKLRAVLSGEREPEITTIPWTLVPREST